MSYRPRGTGKDGADGGRAPGARGSGLSTPDAAGPPFLSGGGLFGARSCGPLRQRQENNSIAVASTIRSLTGPRPSAAAPASGWVTLLLNLFGSTSVRQAVICRRAAVGVWSKSVRNAVSSIASLAFPGVDHHS